MKTLLLKFLYIVLFLAFIPLATFASAEKRNFTLVIDAGHGGHDAGAVGSFSKEKDINLKVALAFGRLVEVNCADVKVIYTRKKDVFIPLQERADIANKNKADLFISIHTNALPNGKQAFGTETYTLGMARASANLAVAKRENSVITMESDYKTTYQGFDPNKAESYVIFEFMQDRFMKQSVDLASCIQKQYTSVGRPNKGVHQAGFLVLRNTSMPSVLTELGFITTPQEEVYLNSQQGIAELSQSIYNGFLAYRRLHDRAATAIPKDVKSQFNGTYAINQVDDIKSANKEIAVVPVAAIPTARLVEERTEDNHLYQKSHRSESVQKRVVANSSSVEKQEIKRTESRNAKNEKEIDKSKSNGVRPAETKGKINLNLPQINKGKDDRPKIAYNKLKNTGTKVQTKDKNSQVTDNKAKDNKAENKQVNKNRRTQFQKNSVTYRIQVGAGKNPIEPSDPQFKGVTVKRAKEGNLYKYFYGIYHAYADAQKALHTVKEKLKNAYIVAYEGGKIVTLSEARAKEKAQQ